MNMPDRPADQAVALVCDRISAPRVTARGNDELAQRILTIAREHGIPVKEEPELVQLLSEVALNDEIPEALYVAVSEVLSFAYMLKGKMPANKNQ